MNERDSSVEKLAGMALGAGRLYISFCKWLWLIMIVVFCLIAVAIWAGKTRSPEKQHGLNCSPTSRSELRHCL